MKVPLRACRSFPVAQGSLLESSTSGAPALTAAVAIENPDLAARVAAGLNGTANHSAAAGADVVIVALDPESRIELARLRELTARLAGSKVLVIAPSLGPAGVRRAVDAGAAGVLPAEDDLEVRLPSAVRAAAAGQICVPRSLGLHIARPALSYRERQILGLVVLGFTNGDIAARLHLAESTVKSHLSSAFTKLGVRSRREAAAMISDADGGLGPGILAISVASPSPPRNGASE
jgi:DNA-binding NarL/FixJ family response regulator